MTDDLDAARHNREWIENARDQEKKDIVVAYNRGDKTQAICTRFNIKAGQLYPILHKAGVKFRSTDPTNPASSLDTRERAIELHPEERKVTVKPEVLEARRKEVEQKQNTDTDLLIEALNGVEGKFILEVSGVLAANKKELEAKIDGVQNTVDNIINGFTMDEELKIDIIESFMIAAKQNPPRWGDRETAKRILHSIQNIEGI